MTILSGQYGIMLDNKELKRFSDKVTFSEQSPCWEWKGTIKNNGYGVFGVFRNGKWKSMYAHRYMWLFKNGKIGRGKLICHHCDNRKCVNPHHLFQGTSKDNLMDASRKGRCVMQRSPEKRPCGTRNHFCKLSELDIVDIRYLRKMGETISSIAKKFRISYSHAKRIIYRQNWKCIK